MLHENESVKNIYFSNLIAISFSGLLCGEQQSFSDDNNYILGLIFNCSQDYNFHLLNYQLTLYHDYCSFNFSQAVRCREVDSGLGVA